MLRSDRILAARDAAVITQHRIALQKLLRELKAHRWELGVTETAIETAADNLHDHVLAELRAAEDRLNDITAGAI